MTTASTVRIDLPPVRHFGLDDLEDAMGGLRGLCELLNLAADSNQGSLDPLRLYQLLIPLLNRFELIVQDMAQQRAGNIASLMQEVA